MRKHTATFSPANLDDFLPGLYTNKDGTQDADPSQTYRIIGEGRIVMAPREKSRRYWVIQSSAVLSIRHIVFLPEDMVKSDSVTFLKRRVKTDKRIRINRDSKGNRNKGVSNCGVYKHPAHGSLLPWWKSLLYEKAGKAWVLVEVDGQRLE